jgi:hypothetical protein
MTDEFFLDTPLVRGFLASDPGDSGAAHPFRQRAVRTGRYAVIPVLTLGRGGCIQATFCSSGP